MIEKYFFLAEEKASTTVAMPEQCNAPRFDIMHLFVHFGHHWLKIKKSTLVGSLQQLQDGFQNKLKIAKQGRESYP